jgi:anhydro-N-acetylmuramic acid kinase
MKPSHPESMLVLGIMSGTSIDSVDYALCEVSMKRMRLVRHWQAQFPEALKRRLHAAARGESSSHEVGQLHHDLGRFYASRTREGLRRHRPQLVGLHGQTIHHHPHPKAPATLQIGEPAYLVEALRLPVVSNFRSADIAAGGQGAPLATLFHRAVFARPGHHICVNNLGGISNVTSIDRRRGQSNIRAFDTGPSNVLLDLAMRHFTNGRMPFDEDGRWAARGEPDEKAIRGWLKHAYFRQPPPKSTGREMFGEAFFTRKIIELKKLSRFDVLATLTEFTARSLALNYQFHLSSWPDVVILTGGGAANPCLVDRIRQQLRKGDTGTKLVTSDQLGWPTRAMEAAAFALLAYYRWMGCAGNVPETTGAKRAALLGQISEP